MSDPFQFGALGLVLAGLIAAAKLIEWVHKSDLKAMGQAGRWGAVGLFVLSVPLLTGLLMNHKWTEAIGVSAVVLVAFAVYGPRILGQLRPRRPVVAEPGNRAEHEDAAGYATTEAEKIQRSIAVLEKYLRRKTGVAGDTPDARAIPSQIADRRPKVAAEGRRQGNGDSARLEFQAPVLSESEALTILGLAPGAEVAQINEAHRRLMQIFHPDRGGSDYFAVKLNQAKTILLELRAATDPSASAGPRKRSRRSAGQVDSSRSKTQNGG